MPTTSNPEYANPEEFNTGYSNIPAYYTPRRPRSRPPTYTHRSIRSNDKTNDSRRFDNPYHVYIVLLLLIEFITMALVTYLTVHETIYRSCASIRLPVAKVDDPEYHEYSFIKVISDIKGIHHAVLQQIPQLIHSQKMLYLVKMNEIKHDIRDILSRNFMRLNLVLGYNKTLSLHTGNSNVERMSMKQDFGITTTIKPHLKVTQTPIYVYPQIAEIAKPIFQQLKMEDVSIID